ncbi:MAG: family 43 glycosylhydrolase [Anaerolineales bacterium]|nr:family 43 glycosylhydrolase [Anaerolineales bacterium]
MTRLRLSLLALLAVLSGGFLHLSVVRAVSAACPPYGWFPDNFGLKDHSVFKYDGYYYLVSIFIPGERKFAYARSQDLCEWEDLGPILAERTPGTWDEMAIWAPFVLEEADVYYLYYTGVTSDFTQSIMLVTSTDPADPTAWQPQGMIFQPTHPGAGWTAGIWADCRDPHVIYADGQYYLFYTGTDIAGGIVGVASAPAPEGPWTDLGPVVPPVLDQYYESPSVFFHDSGYFLAYHKIQSGLSAGTFTEISETPAGPYSSPQFLGYGWAHEFWQDAEFAWYTSYLTTYKVTIAPVFWNAYQTPPRPMLVQMSHAMYIPNVLAPFARPPAQVHGPLPTPTPTPSFSAPP